MQKTVYVTNKELLSEIHRSKSTFCYFMDTKYARFDVILDSIDEVTVEKALSVIEAKNARPKKNNVDPLLEKPEDVVFRVMTYEHVPLCGDKKHRSRAAAGEGHLRVNFPPFKHYVLRDEAAVEVGRSHWKGDFVTGDFCQDHGRINNALARMFMLLVERYGRRGNWRSYCVDETTEALTQRGWLTYDEITMDDIILSYNDGSLNWSSIKSIFRDDYDGDMFHLTVSGMDALVTPRHKFITTTGLKEVEYLLEKDRLVLMGSAVAAPVSTYSDNFVELVGWAITEGSFDANRSDRNYTRISISQNEGPYADRIRNCLLNLNSHYGEYTKNNKLVVFSLTKDICDKICEAVTNRVLNTSFILSLSESQRELLINTMIDGDGWRAKQGKIVHVGYCQKCKKHTDAFLMLCTLAGYRTTFRQRDIVSFGKPTNIYEVTLFSNNRKNFSMVENIDFHGGKRSGKIKGVGKYFHPNEPTEPYVGKIWCPETEFGSFVARRNGTIYLTGNTYVDEMKASALLQLSQVGLQFNEAMSDNPFSFYTTTVSNSFVRLFNVERKNQNIRDDMLIIAGAKPSFTRQVEHEMSQKALNDGTAAVKAPPAKRGRKPKKVMEAAAAATAAAEAHGD